MVGKESPFSRVSAGAETWHKSSPSLRMPGLPRVVVSCLLQPMVCVSMPEVSDRNGIKAGNSQLLLGDPLGCFWVDELGLFTWPWACRKLQTVRARSKVCVIHLCNLPLEFQRMTLT